MAVCFPLQREAQKLSGLRPKAYMNTYQTVEKLLALTSHLSPRELAVRLDCLVAVPLAERILSRYVERMKQQYSAAQGEGMDLHKPRHTATALYCACK